MRGHPEPPPRQDGDGGGDLTLREELERVRVRDPRALEAFFDRHFTRVHALARLLVGDIHDAEDLTQEIFFRVYRAAHRLDPGRDPVPWVMAIAYNACKDFWRSAARRMSRRSVSIEAVPELAAELPAEEADPERQALMIEEERSVQAAILRLPENLRMVVLLRDYVGMSHEDIAAAIGVTHEAARKRYSRALAELARHLRDLRT